MWTDLENLRSSGELKPTTVLLSPCAAATSSGTFPDGEVINCGPVVHPATKLHPCVHNLLSYNSLIFVLSHFYPSYICTQTFL